MRRFYLDEILSQIDPATIEITHDYHDKVNAVPIPATLSIEFGEYLAEHSSDVTLALISDYPFPFRKDRNLTEFDQTALTKLSAMPTGEYTEIFKENNILYLHYASPVIMSEGCVACHNTHPDSPKTDWQIGDVRGIQVVEIPVNGAFSELDYELAAMTSAIAMIGFSTIFALLLLNQRADKASAALIAKNKKLAEAQELATQAIAKKEVFLANMSQDIRTPLNALVGMLGLVQYEGLSNKNKETFNIIQRSADSLLKIVSTALAETNGAIYKQTPTMKKNETAREIITSAIAPYKIQSSNVHGTFELEISINFPENMPCDEDLFEKFLGSILSVFDFKKVENATHLRISNIPKLNVDKKHDLISVLLQHESNEEYDLIRRIEGILYSEVDESQLIDNKSKIVNKSPIIRLLQELDGTIAMKRLSDTKVSIEVVIPYNSEKILSIEANKQSESHKTKVENNAQTIDAEAIEQLKTLVVEKNPIFRNILSNILIQHGATVVARGNLVEQNLSDFFDQFDLIFTEYPSNLFSDFNISSRMLKKSSRRFYLVLTINKGQPLSDDAMRFSDAFVEKPCEKQKIADIISGFKNKISN
jgi:CheY-like chemotaxis protein